MKLINHESDSGEFMPNGLPDPLGYSVSVSGSTWPGAAVTLDTHFRMAANRSGVNAAVPLTAVEALALASVLRDYALRALAERIE